MVEVRTHTVDTIAVWLSNRIAEELKAAPELISPDETFHNVGLNSLNTLIVSGDLAEFLGLDEFNPSMFWDYPTIGKLSQHVFELLQGATSVKGTAA